MLLTEQYIEFMLTGSIFISYVPFLIFYVNFSAVCCLASHSTITICCLQQIN